MIIKGEFLHKNIRCGYSLESPRRGDSNEYPQHMFLWRTDKDYLSVIIKYPPYLFHLYCLSKLRHSLSFLKLLLVMYSIIMSSFLFE